MFSLELIDKSTPGKVFPALVGNSREKCMARKQKESGETVETGMEVEATKGDLGEDDVSKPKVTEVVHDQQGEVDKVVVQKGVIFRKT